MALKLLKLEFLLWWRTFSKRSSKISFILIAILFLLLWHFVSYHLVSGFKPDSLLAPIFFSLVCYLLLSLMIAMCIRGSVESLYERGDVDFLLSSPINPIIPFLIRFLSLFFQITFLVALFICPIANVLLWFGEYKQAMGIYGTLIGLGIIATSIGYLATILLVYLFGPRKAKTIAQILGALVGASMYFFSQTIGHSKWFGAWIIKNFSLSWLNSSNNIYIPGRAALGDTYALCELLGSGAVIGIIAFIFGGKILTLGLHNYTISSKRKNKLEIPQFKSIVLLTTFKKEWKIIRRDPFLVSNTLLQLVYFIPMLIPLFMGKSKEVAFLTLINHGFFGFGIIILSGTLIVNLLYIAMIGEESPLLLSSSPYSKKTLRLYKLFAIVFPIWVVFLIPVIWLMIINFFIGALTFMSFSFATLTVALFIASDNTLVKRNELMSFRRKQGNTKFGFAGAFTMIVWAVAQTGQMYMPFIWKIITWSFGFLLLVWAAWAFEKAVQVDTV
jgi:ABC-2 type transport system permease protein